MLITFKKTRTNEQGNVSIPKKFLEKLGINPESSKEEREVQIYMKGDKIIIERL